MLGVILTFYNMERELNKKVITKLLSKSENMFLCLVNNASSDGTLDVLNNLYEKFPNQIGVVDIKRKTSVLGALKVGFRFLMSKKKVNHISLLNNHDELNLLTKISKEF